MIYKILQNGG